MNAIVPVAMPLQDMQTLAVAIAKSALFGIKTPEQALVLMAIAQAEGRHPVEAARDYDVIQGRPAKKAEAMMRDFIQAGGKIEWHSLTDELADATFTHPQTGSVRIDWDMKRAQVAFGKKDMYSKFPRQMLRSRVVSEGVRTLWPLATSGMYEPGEAADIPTEHNGPTIEHAASDEREQMNREVPLRAAAAVASVSAAMPRGARLAERAPAYEAPPKPHPQMPNGPVDPNPVDASRPDRTDAQWRTWLDKLRAATEVLYRKEEVVELGNRASVGDAIAAGPAWVRAEVSAILAENYARFPEGELPEVEIEGERNVMAG